MNEPSLKQFRKRPVTIEAVRFDGSQEAAEAIVELFGDDRLTAWAAGRRGKNEIWTIVIDTLEGAMRAAAGDWIIKGIKGELYPCKHEIFIQTYDPVVKVELGKPAAYNGSWRSGSVSEQKR